MPEIRVTELGYEIELEPTPSTFVTELGYEIELEPIPSVAVTEFGYEIEFQANSEIPGGSGEIYATESIVLAEMEADPVVDVTESIVLAEIEGEGVIYATEFLVLLELDYIKPAGATMPTYFVRAAGRRDIHRQIPEPITGYAFDENNSWWSAIVAQKGKNLIKNASFEGGLTVGDFSSLGSVANFEAIAHGPYGATHGRYAAKHTSGTSDYFVYADSLSVTPGVYTFSFDLYAVSTPLYLILFVQDNGESLTVGAPFSTNTVIAANQIKVDMSGWHRVHLSYSELGSGLRKVGIGCASSEGPNAVFWTDAWQFERSDLPTTFIYGDMVGFNDRQPNESYYFEGAPHESASVRMDRTGSGGKIISLSEDTGFATTGIIGLGMTPVEQITQTTASGREIHRTIRDLPNDFTITGYICGKTYNDLNKNHTALVKLFRPNNTPNRDQMILRYQALDGEGFATGFPVDIVCVYKDGLRGNITNLYQERIGLQFHSSDPFMIETIDSAYDLQLNQKLYQNGIIYRSTEGEFMNLGTGPGDVYARTVDFNRDGDPIATGSFTEICGDTVTALARWNGTNWVQWGTPNGVNPTTYIYHIDTGVDTGYDPVLSNARELLEYNEISDQWDPIGSMMNNLIMKLSRVINGDIYFCGDFTNNDAGSNSYLAYIAKYDYSTNSTVPVGRGTDGSCTCIMTDQEGYVWVGGNFLTAYDPGGNPVNNNYIARWNIEDQVWDDNAGVVGLNSWPTEIILGQDGYIYAVGGFTRDGQNLEDVRGFARWDGLYWEEVIPLTLADGTYSGGGDYGIVQDKDGIFWIWTTAGSSAKWFDVSDTIAPCTVFGWRDGVFYEFPGDNIGAMRDWKTRDGNESIISYYAVNSGGSPAVSNQVVVTAALNRIDYAGTADAPIVINIDGECKPVQFVSNNKELGVYFVDSLTIGEGEHFVCRNDMLRSTVYTNGRSTLSKFINPGASDLRNLKLSPGENLLSVYCRDADAADGWMTYRNRYYGISQTLV